MRHNNQFGLHMWKAIIFIVTLLMGVAAHAQAGATVIEAVNASARSGSEVVRIDFSRELTTLPTGFVTQSPARISLDFMGIGSAMGRSNIALNEANLRSINVVQAGNRTRVVLNLKQTASYTTEIDGKSLLVTLQPGAAATRTTTPANTITSFSENSRTRDSAPLRDIDFRRSTDGAGRVIITLPHDRVGVDVRQQGKGLTVEFLKTTLPEGLRRRLDVADFGTPVKVVTSTQAGDRVRMLIEPTGLWEHSAYQSDDKFVIEVKQVKTDPKKLTQGVGYNGQKLSLNFQNIEVRSLLQVFADFSNLNIVTSDTVTGSVTLRLQDVPWDQALDIILQSKNLGRRKNGNVLWIAPTEEIITKEKLDMEAASTVQTLEPVKTQFFQINYAKADEIAAQLTANNTSIITNPGTGAGGTGASGSARLLSPRGSVIAMKRTNQLFVTDIPSKLEEVQNLITKVDVAVDQILIEARLVEAADNFGKSLGVKLGGADLRAVRGGDGGYQLNGDTRAAWGTNYSNAVGSSNVGAAGGVPVNQIGNFVNFPAGGLTNAPGINPASLALSIFDATANRMLNLEISALEADGKGKVVSSPKVVTSNQKQASIENGYKIPYTKAGINGGLPTTEFVPATLKLLVTPQTTPDGRIILMIEVNKDEPWVALGAGATKTKSIKTEVLVESGGTVVIGGIFEESKDTIETKVPLLGDIPFIGNLFKSKTTNTNKQELLVFITPKLLTDRALSQ